MSAKFTRSVFEWLDQVALDRNLPASAFKVAYAIAQCLNEDSGEAFPGSDTIARRIGMSQATVIAMVRQLKTNGHLGVEPGRPGRGHSNRYRKIVKPQPAEVLEAQSVKVSEPQPSELKPQPAKLKPQPADMNYLSNHKGSDLRSLSLVDGCVTELVTDAYCESETESETILVAEPADNAPIAPALATEIAAAAASPTILHIIRDPAVAGRMFQHMLETASDDAALNPALRSNYDEAKMNPTVLHHPIPVSKYDDHDYLHHHDKHPLQAPRFKNTGRGVVIDNDSGVIVGTFDDLPQKSHPPPKARAQTYGEAIYGVA
jgi:hypothetical protein